MLNTTKRIEAILVCALALTIASVATAQDGTPKGKPFVEINGQIAEVQQALVRIEDELDKTIADVIPRLADLEGKVETLEDAKLVTEQAIVDLQAKNTELETLIAATDTSLEAEIAELQAQIDTNTEMLLLMQQQLGSLQIGLDAKQNVIDGLCADGSAIAQVNEDGSVVCAAPGVDSSGTGLSGFTKVEKTVGSWLNATSKHTVSCPATAVPISTAVYSYYGCFSLNGPTWEFNYCGNPNLSFGAVYSEVESAQPGGSARFVGSFLSGLQVTTLSVICAEQP